MPKTHCTTVKIPST